MKIEIEEEAPRLFIFFLAFSRDHGPSYRSMRAQLRIFLTLGHPASITNMHPRFASLGTPSRIVNILEDR